MLTVNVSVDNGDDEWNESSEDECMGGILREENWRIEKGRISSSQGMKFVLEQKKVVSPGA